MLHAGRRRQPANPRPPDRGGPRRAGLGVVESMTGARIVHDTLEQEGWEVEIADAGRSGTRPAALQDRQDRLQGPGDALSPARPPHSPMQAETKGPGIGNGSRLAVLS
jgi:hypothetical protein